MPLSDLSRRAVAMHEAGDLAGAETQYLRMLAASPGDFTALHMFGLLRAQQGRLDDAIRLIGKAARVDPGVYLMWMNYAAVLETAGRHSEAVDCYDRALALQPASLDALGGRANLLWALGQTALALNDFDKALSLQPRDLALLNNSGNLLCQVGRADAALQKYAQALTIEPNVAETWTNQGMALTQLGRFDEALESHDRALAIAPDLSAIWSNRGLTLRAMNRLQDALADAAMALSIQPGDKAALDLQGKIFCETGQIAEGFEAFGLAAGVTPIGGQRVPGPAVDLRNVPAATEAWTASDPHSVVVDQFLTPAALEGLRRFCQTAEMWRSHYEPGYVGAFPESGVACPLLAQIAEELRDGFPQIIGEHGLRYAWAFKYDSAGGGTHVHADDAAVNVNFWITPDESNIDPDSGGLVFWDKAAPPDWDYERFNVDEREINDFLERSGAAAITVPYRCNRAVIFDSSLFHATDRFQFRDGEADRRINITLLYGRRT